MPAFAVLNGGGLQQRRTRLIAVALFVTLVLIFLGNSRLSDDPSWRSTDVHLPPPPEKVAHEHKEPPPEEQLTSEGESQEESVDEGDSYRDKDDELANFPSVTTSLVEEVEEPTAIPTSTLLEDVEDPTITPTSASPEHVEETTATPTLRYADYLDVSQSSQPSHPTQAVECQPFEQVLRTRPGPESDGKFKFPYVRPPPECRTFKLPEMETLIDEMRDVVKDPDLFRLFENSYPITLDTMVKWRGYAAEYDPVTKEMTNTTTDQELTYVITGDIDAMWLRDSASQIYSYLPLLKASNDPDSLASLWRGLINSHSRYIIISPYCHSFQPPPESGIPPTTNGAFSQNDPRPPYNPIQVFDCKWELDSLASFLQISVGYYEKTRDAAFFQKYDWIAAVAAAVDAAGAMRLGTYAADGKVQPSAWTFTGWTNRGSETLTNDGLGNPSKENGMVRTAFRPSDDACIFQFLVPANMMWAKYLEDASEIMAQLDGEQARNLTTEMRDFAFGIRKGIEKDAIVPNREFGDIFAYEVDGFGGSNLMDDANVPSLLAMPLWNFTKSAYKLPDPPKGESPRDYAAIYQNTRRFVLSESNPYFMKGPAISAVGGPHVGPGKAWPMAAVIAAMTAYDPISGVKDVDKEVEEQVMMVLNSTSGSGVLHESVNSWNERDWTRAWFGWANGLFGELILKIREEGKEDGLLAKSWQ